VSKRQTINDEDRKEWVQNDEGLYRMFRNWRGGYALGSFVRAHRKEIDEVIVNVRDGKKPAHYLVYGG